jgi:mono/diheme cytochrome c family protein
VFRRVLLIAVVVFACKNEWRTDMWYQPSHRPQSLPRPEPAGSVAIGSLPTLLDVDDGDELKNPLPSQPPSVEHGRRIFGERCACCHGPDGRGKGPVSKFFPPAPDLTYVAIRARTDGHLYATLTLGGRAMPSQAEGLTPKDRWDIVNFVRTLQKGAGGAP